MPHRCQRSLSWISCSTRTWSTDPSLHLGRLFQWRTHQHIVTNFWSSSHRGRKRHATPPLTSFFAFCFVASVSFLVLFFRVLGLLGGSSFLRVFSSWLKSASLIFRSYVQNGLVQLPWTPLSCGKSHHAPELYWITGFLPFFEPTVDWEFHDADQHRRAPPYPLPSPHHPHTGRHLHTFVPIPSPPAHPTLASHGGIPSHIVSNPEPNLRPVSIRPPDNTHPSNTARARSSRGEIFKPGKLSVPIHSTTIGGPTNPGTENPPTNPEARPKKKQRVHVTVSESHATTITAPHLTPGGGHPTDGPTTDESDSDHRSRPSNPRIRPPPIPQWQIRSLPLRHDLAHLLLRNVLLVMNGLGILSMTLLCHHHLPSIMAFVHGPAAKTTSWSVTRAIPEHGLHGRQSDFDSKEIRIPAKQDGFGWGKAGWSWIPARRRLNCQ